MRGLVQRVSQASVTVGDEVVGAIGPGLCVLVGVTHDDTEATARKLADKIRGLRVIDDDDGVMNRSIADTGSEVLIVSQFTLYGDTSAGRRPSWIKAARPEHAEPLVQVVIDQLRASGLIVAAGRFRTEMQLSLINDGPVTVLLRGLTCRAANQALPGTIHAPSRAISASNTHTTSSSCEYHVRPEVNGIVRMTTFCSLTAVRSNTSPAGDTNALNPVGDT